MNLYFNGPQNVFRLDPTLSDLVALDPLNPIKLGRATQVGGDLLLNTVNFGDGYKQVAEAGLRPLRRRFQLSFEKVPDKVTLALRRFFEGSDVFAQTGGDSGTIYNRRPSEYFYMRLPFPVQDTSELPMRLLMTSAPAYSNNDWNSWTVTVPVEEWFGL